MAGLSRGAYGRLVSIAARSLEPLIDGRRALARGAWPQAREAFEAALADQESPEAWEGLGWAAWWLSDEPLTCLLYTSPSPRDRS